MTLSYEDTLLTNARNLRKEMTRQERHIWYDFLRMYPVKFYKQRPIDHYIVDFYCAKAKLVIELDGSQHYMVDGMEYDVIRTEILEKYGLYVLRISNRDIDIDFAGVCQMIEIYIQSKV